MREEANNYAHYFKEESQAKIGINLADYQYLEVSGFVRSIEEDLLTLVLVGVETYSEMTAEPNSEVFITLWTGWSPCRCSGVLLEKIRGRKALIRLNGPVIEKQTRENFRLDVSIPISYSIPEKQILADVHEEWDVTRKLLLDGSSAPPLLVAIPDGFKVVNWKGSVEIAPRMVNLGGEGLRFKTQEFVSPESLVVINLFLPLTPPRVVHTVAETLRCSRVVLDREKGEHYITATRFHFIGEKDQEAIISFIFAEQRRFLTVNKRI